MADGDVLGIVAGHQQFGPIADYATAIAIDETDATTPTVIGPIDTRSVNALALLARIVTTTDPGTAGLQVTVLTRKTGLPWLICPITEFDGGFNLVGITLATFATSAGTTLERYQGFTASGLLDETIIVGEPIKGPGSEGVGTSFTNGTPDIFFAPGIVGTLGSLLSVEFVDPGAANQPLRVSSTDGYVWTVTLQTDGSSNILTSPKDIANLASNGAYPYALIAVPNDASSDLPVQAFAPLQLIGTSSAVTMTYSVKGSL